MASSCATPAFKSQNLIFKSMSSSRYCKIASYYISAAARAALCCMRTSRCMCMRSKCSCILATCCTRCKATFHDTLAVVFQTLALCYRINMLGGKRSGICNAVFGLKTDSTCVSSGAAADAKRERALCSLGSKSSYTTCVRVHRHLFASIV